MFSFFKKKPKQVTKPLQPIELSQAEISTIQAQVTEQKKIIKEIAVDDLDQLAKAYEVLGVLEAKIAIDESINSLEKSLAYRQSIGEGYKVLMSLYNQKRSLAAHQGDGDGIDKWMSKMDELRQIARNKTISS